MIQRDSSGKKGWRLIANHSRDVMEIRFDTFYFSLLMTNMIVGFFLGMIFTSSVLVVLISWVPISKRWYPPDATLVVDKFYINGLVFVGKILTGNHRLSHEDHGEHIDFPMKIMGLSCVFFFLFYQSIDSMIGVYPMGSQWKNRQARSENGDFPQLR